MRLADPLEEFLDLMADSPVVGLAVAPVVAGLAAVLARGVATLGLLAPGLAGPIVAASVLGVVCAAQLGGALVAVVRPAEGRRAGTWQVAGVVAGLGSIGISVETFALVTACLWRGAGQPADPWAGLWRAESFYLWHVLGSIPLIDIAGTVGWRTPAFAAAHTPAALVLAFKFVVIVPLLRTAVTGYRLAVQRSTAEASRAFEPDDLESTPFVARGPVLAGLVGVVCGLLAAGIVWAYGQAFEERSAINLWWRGVLRILHADASPVSRWTPVVPGAAVLVLTVAAAAWFNAWTEGLPWELLPVVRSGWHAIAVLAAVLVLLATALLWAAGLLLTLARLRLGVHLPAGVGLWPVGGALLWDLADMLPGPDIPATLKWRPPVDIIGPAAGWVVLLFKLIVAGTVLAAIPVVRTATIRIRYAPVIDVWAAGLDAAAHLFGPHTVTGFHPFYDRRRRILDRLAADFPETARFADVYPHVRALLAALPPADLRQTPEPARVAASLLSYRSAVREAFAGAAGIFDDPPDWLTAVGERGASPG
jgi:hypothetical protein